MPNCTTKQLNFSPLRLKKITGSFSGGSITNDGGLLLLREIDKKYKITDRLGSLVYDPLNPLYITHSEGSMLRQRIYAIAANYEDLNDHDYLRHDLAFQTVINKNDELAVLTSWLINLECYYQLMHTYYYQNLEMKCYLILNLKNLTAQHYAVSYSKLVL